MIYTAIRVTSTFCVPRLNVLLGNRKSRLDADIRTGANQTLPNTERVNSVWLNDAMWRQRSESRFAQVMACCMAAPSECLNKSWFIISEVQWYLSESNFTRETLAINSNLLQNLASTTVNSFGGICKSVCTSYQLPTNRLSHIAEITTLSLLVEGTASFNLHC